MRDRKEGRAARIMRRLRQPDFVRKAGPHRRKPERYSRSRELASAIEEWAEDYEGTHSIFED